MDINIRKSVKNNLKGTTSSEIYQTIEESIKLGEENVLPGLGVLFESLWQNANNDLKTTIVNELTDYLE